MCISSFQIPNPNRGAKTSVGLNFTKDTTSSFIDVPCGHCPECIASKQGAIVARLVTEAKKSHVFFATLTYDNAHLPRLVVGDYEIPFADFSHLTLMFKRIRDNLAFSRPFKYAAVSELGSTRARPHFHILFFVPRHEGDTHADITMMENELRRCCFKYFAENIGTRKKPVYQKLFTYRRLFIGGKVKTNFDLHYVNESLTKSGYEDSCYYVSKYITKPSDKETRRQQALHMNLSSEDYDKVWGIVRCKMRMSKGLGICSHMETREVVVYPQASCEMYCKYIDYCANCTDLPMTYLEFLGDSKIVRRRVMVPDLDVCAELHKNVLLLRGKAEYPTFVRSDGKLVPLPRYYKRFRQVFNEVDYLTLYYDYDENAYPRQDKRALTKQSISNKQRCYASQIKQIELHGSFPSDLDAAGLFE